MSQGVQQIKKVSSNGTISYTDQRGFDHDVSPPDSIKPHPDFNKALQALLADGLETAGVGLLDGTKAEVRYLNVYPQKDNYEFSIGLVITPNGGGSCSPTAPKRSYNASPLDRQKRVDLMIAEAINFVGGKYNQGELFEKEGDREAKPSAKVTPIEQGKEAPPKAAKKNTAKKGTTKKKAASK